MQAAPAVDDLPPLLLAGGPRREIALDETVAGVVVRLEAEPPADAPLTWRILGGADAAGLLLHPASGALRFLVAPDFERPADADADNTYEVLIEARDVWGTAATQLLLLRVADLPEATDAGELRTGTAAADTLSGLAGADTLQGDAGDDLLLAGPDDGDDLLDGGDGADLLAFDGIAAAIQADLRAGHATSEATGRDTLRGIEQLRGGEAADRLAGDALANRLLGGGGGDALDGRRGADTLLGEAGADSLSGGGQHDRLEGGAGEDTLLGGTGRDTLAGGTGDDRLDGGAGHDLLAGGDGADTLHGGRGADTLAGDEGADRLEGGAGQDRLDGGGGADTLLAEDGRDMLAGGEGADLFLLAGPSAWGATILDFRGWDDRLAIPGTAFGLPPEGDPVAEGQLVFDPAAASLAWDRDGPGGLDPVVLAWLPGAMGWAGAEILPG